MLDSKRRLKVWLNPEAELDDSPSPPTLAQLLYAPPNPDKTTKSCQNCVQWLASDQQCGIHSPAVAAPPDGICGYHVWGEPDGGSARARGKIMWVEVQDSGLEQVPGGASCSTCAWLRGSTCAAARDEHGGAAQVEQLGCCVRWEARA